jgi:hypothetical protein
MKRIYSFDLARGLTVLMIAPIHTVLVYSKLEVRSTWLGYILGFIAEGPGAQLFMLLMGVYIAFQKPVPFSSVCKRSLILLLTGYTLNVLKFCLPMQLHLLPLGLLNDLGTSNDTTGMIQLFYIGDILQFAAIALIIVNLFRRFLKYYEYAIIAAILVCFVSPFAWNLSENYLSQSGGYILELIGGQPPHIFFPLFPWLVYPLTGLAIGYYLKWPNQRKVFHVILYTGAVCLIAGYLLGEFILKQHSESFYRTYPGDTLMHLGIVLITLWCWQWLAQHIRKNLFFDLLVFCSKNITPIYIIQWPLIIWLLPLFGYQHLDLPFSILAIVFTGGWTMGLLLIYKHLTKIYQNKKNHAAKKNL